MGADSTTVSGGSRGFESARNESLHHRCLEHNCVGCGRNWLLYREEDAAVSFIYEIFFYFILWCRFYEYSGYIKLNIFVKNTDRKSWTIYFLFLIDYREGRSTFKIAEAADKISVSFESDRIEALLLSSKRISIYRVENFRSQSKKQKNNIVTNFANN